MVPQLRSSAAVRVPIVSLVTLCVPKRNDVDVYFERIAGVSDPNAPKDQAAAPLAPPTAAAAAPSTASDALDPNGFPLSPMQDQDHLWFVQVVSLIHSSNVASTIYTGDKC